MIECIFSNTCRFSLLIYYQVILIVSYICSFFIHKVHTQSRFKINNAVVENRVLFIWIDLFIKLFFFHILICLWSMFLLFYVLKCLPIKWSRPKYDQGLLIWLFLYILKISTEKSQCVDRTEFQAFVSIMSHKVQHLEKENKVLKKSIELATLKPREKMDHTMQCKYKLKHACKNLNITRSRLRLSSY